MKKHAIKRSAVTKLGEYIEALDSKRYKRELDSDVLSLPLKKRIPLKIYKNRVVKAASKSAHRTPLRITIKKPFQIMRKADRVINDAKNSSYLLRTSQPAKSYQLNRISLNNSSLDLKRQVNKSKLIYNKEAIKPLSSMELSKIIDKYRMLSTLRTPLKFSN
eukprot:TRINITY_DN12159_c0_g1_i1.p1 TRINITY_DN12159_c0_g1~~TRINITY_DN12159_c0_g1_i1.p1  ORF type:complete len:162 (+),score=26.22 TRINITY_DN12159_c0_g1_i1:174-659(+)